MAKPPARLAAAHPPGLAAALSVNAAAATRPAERNPGDDKIDPMPPATTATTGPRSLAATARFQAANLVARADEHLVHGGDAPAHRIGSDRLHERVPDDDADVVEGPDQDQHRQAEPEVRRQAEHDRCAPRNRRRPTEAFDRRFASAADGPESRPSSRAPNAGAARSSP